MTGHRPTRHRAENWPRIGLDPGLWSDTRIQAHHAVQLLASFAGEFLEPRDDDGHRSLCWVANRSLLATGSAERGDAPLTVTFDPAAFVLGLGMGPLDHHDAAAEEELRADARERRLVLEGRTVAEARAWLAERIAETMGIAPTLSAPEYSIPEHAVAGGSPFAPDPTAAVELGRWFGSAAEVLGPFSRRDDAGPLRCWPHHFDIATLIKTRGATGEASAPTVGVGVSPGDESTPLPYGYVTPYPYPWERPRPSLEFGYWHTEGWLGAVLPADAWTGEGSPTRVVRFFEQAVRVAETLLSPP